MLTAFLWAATISFFVIGCAWSKKDFFNFLIKVFLFFMFIAGLLLLLKDYGIIVKTTHA